VIIGRCSTGLLHRPHLVLRQTGREASRAGRFCPAWNMAGLPIRSPLTCWAALRSCRNSKSIINRESKAAAQAKKQLQPLLTLGLRSRTVFLRYNADANRVYLLAVAHFAGYHALGQATRMSLAFAYISLMTKLRGTNRGCPSRRSGSWSS
jgi:hypothetical protein